jgi:N-carbamoylputrescine amidase
MAGVYHNSAYIIDTDGSEAGLYRKMHIRMILIFMKILFYTWRFGIQNHSLRKENWNTYLLGSMVSWRLDWLP